MESKLDQVLNRITELAKKVDQQNNRIEKLEQTLHIEAPKPVPQEKQIPPKRSQPTNGVQTKKEPEQALEFRFGKYALQIIGITVFLFGMGFLLKYSVEQGWVSPLVRIITGLVVATGLVGASELFGNRLGQWAFGLTAGGIILYYLSIYAAYGFYGLVTLQQAFIALCAVSLGATLLGLRHNSRLIAVFSLVGGMAAPLVLYIDKFDPYFLAYYLFALAVGFLALSYIKNWFVLSWLSFFALVMYKQLFINLPLGSALIFYAALFVVYVLVPYLYAMLVRLKNMAFESTMITVAGAYIFAAVTNRIIYHNFFDKEVFQAVFSFIVTLFANQPRIQVLNNTSLFFGSIFLLLSVGAYYRFKHSLLFNAVSRLAIVIFAIFILTKWSGLTLTLVWYFYALVLLACGLLFAMPQIRWWSYLFWLCGFGNFILAGFDARLSITSWLNNQITITAVLAVALFTIASYITQRYHAVLQVHEKSIYKRFDIAVVLTCFYWIMVAWQYPYTILGLIWLAFALWAIGVACGGHLRRSAYGIGSYAVFYFFYYHTILLRMQSDTLHLIFGSLAVTFALVRVLYQQHKQRLSDFEQKHLGVIVDLGLVGTLFFWGRATILLYFGFYAHREAQSLIHAILTVYYGAYALLLILVGLFKKKRYVRYCGLAILGVTMYKLWFIIMGMPETLHRIIAFILVGVLFILASFAYQILSGNEKK